MIMIAVLVVTRFFTNNFTLFPFICLIKLVTYTPACCQFWIQWHNILHNRVTAKINSHTTQQTVNTVEPT